MIVTMWITGYYLTGFFLLKGVFNARNLQHDEQANWLAAAIAAPAWPAVLLIRIGERLK